MKKKFYVLSLCLSLLSFNVFSKEIFVSLSGDDITGNGTLEHPYLTINRARIAARVFKSTQDVNIFIRGGIYYLNSTIVFDSNDSGENGYKIKYNAYNNETVTISGGIKITSVWTPDQNGIWKVDLSNLNTDTLIFRQLWVDNEKAQRSHCGINITKEPNSKTENIEFDNTDSNGVIISKAKHIADIEIWTYLRWMANIVKVDRVVDNTIFTNIKTPYYRLPNEGDKVQDIFDVQNAYEFIDKPGEWFYNKYTNYLYYYPLNNKNPNSSDIVFPVLEKLISATNLTNTEFNGLRFSHATWTFPNREGYITGQGTIYIKYVEGYGNINHNVSLANVEFSGCSNITIRNNTFIHLGAEAICFQNTSCNNIIDSNIFVDIAGTGIRIGNGRDYDITTAQLATKNNIISNNIITNAANEFRSHCGIWLGFVNNNQVNNNKLSDLPYSGISTGYPCNGLNGLQLGANEISNNEISDVMNELRDGGAIYNFGPSEIGLSTIRHNKICNIREAADNAGIYLDEMSTYFLVKDNYGNITQNDIFKNNSTEDDLTNSYSNNVFYGCSKHWINYDTYAPEYHTAAEGYGDLGVRFVDVNHDGLKDMVYFRWISNTNIQKGVYLNECGKWGNRLENSPFCLPYHLYADGFGDLCVKFIDFDHDGYDDMLYSREGYADQCRAYRNTGSGWQYTPNYNPPLAFYKDGIGDLGVRCIDVNHDGLIDLVQSRWVNSSLIYKKCFLNTGNGWQESSDSKYLLPYHITADGLGDMGVRIVDLNNDGFDDIVYWRWNNNQKGAYVNTGSGWSYAPSYVPKYPTSLDNAGDLGVKFIDVNHDSIKDMVVNRKVTTDRQEKLVWLNKNSTWVSSSSDYAPVIPTYIDYEGGTQGVLIVDLNGDGFEDILQNYWKKTSQAYLNNSTTFFCSNSGTLNTLKHTTQINLKKSNIEVKNSENFILSFYPNPFSKNSNIVLDVNNKENIEINLYSIRGVLIEVIANDVFEKGSYLLSLNTELKTGVYLLRARSTNNLQYKKIIKE